jgi:hypothetical protein
VLFTIFSPPSIRELNENVFAQSEFGPAEMARD